MSLKIRKKDQVVVLTGKEKGKRGEVLRVVPTENRVIVAKVNLIKRHRRATREKEGGIITMEASLPMANVALVCPKCNQPVRFRTQILADSSKVRVCRKCGEHIL